MVNYIRHTSGCLCVRLPQSHRCLCSWTFLTCRLQATRIIQERKGVNCFAIQSAINGWASRLG
ncbi:hypothetical protein B6174_18380 [Salmonella enterica]|nr:hypothetical protein [Salmonella enterica]EBR0108077.1 hypothetical protein [Salmonella enterica subsp. houtenae serovar Houten]EBS0298571.1 hypothetical protein [Salmonella enterica subsp. houtenae serovar Houten]ECE6509321.1 hypothetical protein [Salmonella enterica subsp. houtenae]ECI2703882.1 hypothetical protein [Salmonella enterica]